MAKKPARSDAVKFLDLSWGDRWVLLKAGVLLVVARAALRLLPLRPVLEFASATRTLPRRAPALLSKPEASTPAAALADDLGRLVWGVDVMGRRLFPGNPCLTQAIVVQRLLRRRGYSSELRIGVKKLEAEALQAHAWVENHGNLIIGGRGLDPDFQAFPNVLPDPVGGEGAGTAS